MMQEPEEAETAADQALELVRDRSDTEEFPMHEECTAILTMKCGEPRMAVRKKLHEEIPITFRPDEGFGVFQSKVERHFSKISPSYVQEKRGIYLKPSTNATQSKYVLLTKDNFMALLRNRWKMCKSMKVELKYDIFCYFVDATERRGRKPTKTFQKQLLASQNTTPASAIAPDNATFLSIMSPLLSGHSISQAVQNFGEAAATGAPMLPSDKKLHGSDSPSLSANGRDTTGLSNLHESDSDRPRKAARVEGRFQSIPFRVNGVVLPLEVDVIALRRAIGLELPEGQDPETTPDAEI